MSPVYACTLSRTRFAKNHPLCPPSTQRRILTQHQPIHHQASMFERVDHADPTTGSNVSTSCTNLVLSRPPPPFPLSTRHLRARGCNTAVTSPSYTLCMGTWSRVLPVSLILLASASAQAQAAEPRCGDGIVSKSEDCDDGNRRNGDGCSATCRNEMLPCGVVDPSAASCSSDKACGFGNVCKLDACTPSFCGCSDEGPLRCTMDCQGTCIARKVIICADRSLPECGVGITNPDVQCVDASGKATPRPNADQCRSDQDCNAGGLCVQPECVSSTCNCSPGEGWLCTDDCSGGENASGMVCRYPGDQLPANHPVCKAQNGSNANAPCEYQAAASAQLSVAPALGGLGALLGLGLMGLARSRRDRTTQQSPN